MNASQSLRRTDSIQPRTETSAGGNTVRVRPRFEVLEDRAVPASLFADFNGDGYDDLAVGMSDAKDSAFAAGAVSVMYGSSAGLQAANVEILTQDSMGLDSSEKSDRFGAALAAGDFNGDGMDDLAIGAPGEDDKSGAVYVLHGSVIGVGAVFARRWDQNSTGVSGGSEANDAFGSSLAVGDFDSDGKDDLAIGVPGEIFSPPEMGLANEGGVHVLYGSWFGVLGSGSQLWSQDTAGIPGESTSWDFFGWALAVGDFNGDGKDDLAIGVPEDDVGDVYRAGAVNVIYGSGNGLTAARSQIWSQNSTGIGGAAEGQDYFGNELAAGDFDGDGMDDLAIGVRGEDVLGYADAGAVNVLYGTANRLSAARNQLWTEDHPSVGGVVTENMYFGASLAVGDFDNDGKDDLVISAPSDDWHNFAGRVSLLTGASAGLVPTRQYWTTYSFPETWPSLEGAGFGVALSVGDYNGDGKADLAIGFPGQDVGGVVDAGSVRVMYGGAGRLSVDRSVLWTLSDLGLLGAAGDGFGWSL